MNLMRFFRLEKPEEDLVTILKCIKVCCKGEEKSIFVSTNKMKWLLITARNTTVAQYWDSHGASNTRGH